MITSYSSVNPYILKLNFFMPNLRNGGQAHFDSSIILFLPAGYSIYEIPIVCRHKPEMMSPIAMRSFIFGRRSRTGTSSGAVLLL